MNYVTDLGQTITEEEMQKIRIAIRENKQTWTSDEEYWAKEKTSPKYWIGSPVMFPLHNSYRFIPLYRKLRSKSESFLNEYSLSSKVLPAVSKFFNKPLEQLAGSSYPGFEVYSSYNGKNNYWDSYEFHVDSCLVDYWDELDFDPKDKCTLDDIYACITPIELPIFGKGTELEYQTPEGVQRTTYQLGHTYVWKSSMLHRPTYVELSEDELRICFISFFILKPDRLLYYI